MDERILDDEDERLIKIKRTQEGTDAVDALLEEGEEDETEVLLDFPEEGEEYDEDLVGLSPEQLAAEKARREEEARKAQEECDSLVAEGKALLEEGKFEEAETFFDQATLFVPNDTEAVRGLWLARTQNFTSTEPFYDEDYALEVAQSTDEVKGFIRENAGEKLEGERKELLREAEPLREKVKAGQDSRRGAFLANKKYYAWRTLAVLAAAVLAIVGILVSASFLTSTRSSLPVVFLIVCAVLAVVLVIVWLLFLRKLLVAVRLCRDNEKLSSTQEGEVLAEIEDKLRCLADVLDDETVE